MKATINLYKNTGFNGVNVPYSPAKLPAPEKVKSDYLYLNSSQNQTTLRLAGSSDWMEYDYISITGDTWGGFSTCYYWVTGYNILTNEEIEYTLAPDWWTTLGGAPVIGAAIEDGMVSRIPKADALARASAGGLNVIEDMGFQPSQPLRVLFNYDTTDDIKATTSGHFTDDETLIASTINLAANDRIAQTFDDVANNLKVTVPSLPPVSKQSTVTMGNMVYKLAGFGLYQWQPSNANFNANIEMIWGLNLQDAIKSVYILPKEILNYLGAGISLNYSSEYPGGVPWVDLTCPWKEVRISLADLYTHSSGSYDYVERQAIAKFAKLILASETSGDNKVFDLTDVANILDGSAANDYVNILMTADLSPGGKTYIKPKNFQGRTNTYFKNSVAGTPWLTQPIEMMGVSGQMVAEGLQSLRNSYELDKMTNSYNTGLQNLQGSYNAQLEAQKWTEGGGMILNGLDSAIGVLGSINAANIAGKPVNATGMAIGSSKVAGSIISPFLSQQAGDIMYKQEVANQANSFQAQVANQALSNALAQQEIQIAHNLAAPTLLFNRDPGIANYVLNGFYIGVVGLSQTDVDIFRRYMDFNGVAVCQPFKIREGDNFTAPTSTNRYSYYKFDSLKFKRGTFPSIIANEVQVQLLNGIRICGEY